MLDNDEPDGGDAGGAGGWPIYGPDGEDTGWRAGDFVNGQGLLGMVPPANGDTAPMSANSSANPGSSPPISSAGGAQYAQELFPFEFFARPPIELMRPYEELPQGSKGGPNAGQPFSRSSPRNPGDPCTYCGKPTTKEPGPRHYNKDHVIPRSQGGNNSPENETPACRTCNLQKGPRTPAQWYFGDDFA